MDERARIRSLFVNANRKGVGVAAASGEISGDCEKDPTPMELSEFEETTPPAGNRGITHVIGDDDDFEGVGLVVVEQPKEPKAMAQPIASLDAFRFGSIAPLGRPPNPPAQAAAKVRKSWPWNSNL